MIREILKKHRASPKVLVENKVSFAAANSELSIYDTFQNAVDIELASDQMMFCGMVTGKKVMHANQGNFESEFLPHESFVMAPNSPVTIDFPTATPSKPTTCLAIEISQQRVHSVTDNLNREASLKHYQKEWRYQEDIVHTHHNSQTQALLNRIVQIYTENHQDRTFMIDLAVTELIVRLLRHQTREFIISHSTEQPDHNGLNAVVFHLKQNLTTSLDIDALCKLACMSRTKFFGQFKKTLGCTPKDFLYQLRLKQAAKMLTQGSKITEACFAAGYSNTSHFSRSFKTFYGMSPSQYKSRKIDN